MAPHTRPASPTALAVSAESAASLTSPSPRSGEWACTTGFVSDLLVRCGRHDQGALAMLYDLLSPIVTAAVSMGVDRPQVGDRVRDVFVEVWRDAPTYHVGKVSAVEWLMERVSMVSTRPDAPTASPGLAEAG